MALFVFLPTRVVSVRIWFQLFIPVSNRARTIKRGRRRQLIIDIQYCKNMHVISVYSMCCTIFCIDMHTHITNANVWQFLKHEWCLYFLPFSFIVIRPSPVLRRHFWLFFIGPFILSCSEKANIHPYLHIYLILLVLSHHILIRLKFRRLTHDAWSS
jgi:hypothetical protein